MLNALAIVLAADETNSNVPNHWLVGGVTLAILLALILGLLVFGAGREHS
jgi:hypothetical protein